MHSGMPPIPLSFHLLRLLLPTHGPICHRRLLSCLLLFRLRRFLVRPRPFCRWAFLRLWLPHPVCCSSSRSLQFPLLPGRLLPRLLLRHVLFPSFLLMLHPRQPSLLLSLFLFDRVQLPFLLAPLLPLLLFQLLLLLLLFPLPPLLLILLPLFAPPFLGLLLGLLHEVPDLILRFTLRPHFLPFRFTPLALVGPQGIGGLGGLGCLGLLLLR
mmetsp:Transcript_81074/g.135669  ORF Transcript_81074/g.135669 Transcript_81074/m.135669 type:complete len:212 (+) Transcript_81074:574-1209(+)